MNKPSDLHTDLQHAGAAHRVGRGLVGAVEVSVTFTTPHVDDFPVYQRLGNTNNHKEVEEVLAAIEETEDAVIFGSGMAAFHAALMTFLRPGDHVLCQEGCYGTNQKHLEKIMSRFGIQSTFAPLTDWPRHFRPETRMVYCESISNPFCIPQNVPLAVSLAKQHNALSLVDNTFASPHILCPARLGADLVLESATKYLNGHSDVVAGVLAGSHTHMQLVRDTAMYLGGFLSTPGCAQLLRGLKTYALRIAAHSQNGRAVAKGLQSSPFVGEVFHGTRDAVVADHFPNGFGGMMAVRFSSHVDVEALMRRMTLVRDVPSLAGTESTACMPWHTTHKWWSDSAKEAIGLDRKWMRLSVGLENPEHIVSDILEAARHVLLPT